MPMTVKGTDANAVDSGSSRVVEPVRASAPTAPATHAPAGAGQADSLSISGSARSLANLQAAIAGTPDIHVERVERVSKAIESGQYTANPGRIAGRMLRLERDLAAATHPLPR